MDLNAELINQVLGQGIFAVLFVWLLMSERKSSQAREDKLMLQLEKSNDVYTNVIEAVDALKDTIMKQK
ncbi:Protein of unknown function (DUF2762) [Desulfosporosinus acidiphilus SJ4]|uniref:Bacteriocin UviB n=1 Tax=Desulfosporosinus acidiphilus (strain DSM 22704 / JCM 16185 / SJ4) TaxID=646529 RepID=I4D5B8_DESAJ|nr:BhlA/UviB family holin-like peptide [Desulfosporosinus acidiphilus]AFM40992.1 Protein of unknown function (DUF2762) [Desulfosporosinus acidiphilus SJ4]